MSLIQEALRRQQVESGGPDQVSDAPPLQEPAAMPPPAPEVPQPPPPPQSGRKHLATRKSIEARQEPAKTEPIPEPAVEEPPPAKAKGRQQGKKNTAQIVFLVLLLGAGLVWSGIRAFDEWFAGPPKNKVKVSGTVDESRPEFVEKRIDGQPAIPVEAPPPTQPAVARIAPPVPAPVPPIPGLQPVQQIPAPTQPAVQSIPVPTPVEPEPAPAAPPPVLKVKPPPLQWPVITVDGIVGRGKSGAVMIDGQIVRVGDKVQGVQIVSITSDGILMKYGGETRYIKSGQSTD